MQCRNLRTSMEVVMFLFGLEKMFEVTPLLFLQSQKMETNPRPNEYFPDNNLYYTIIIRYYNSQTALNNNEV